MFEKGGNVCGRAPVYILIPAQKLTPTTWT